jgi:hypothetical protein
LKKSFIKAKSRNKLVEVMSMVTSQKEKRFKIIESVNEYGAVKFTYQVGKSLTPIQGAKNQIRNLISSKFGGTFSSQKEVKAFYNNWFKEFSKTNSYQIILGVVKPKKGESAKAIHDFLNSLDNRTIKLNDIDDNVASNILNDLKFFIDRIKDKLGQDITISLNTPAKDDSSIDAKSINIEDGEKQRSFYDIEDVLDEDNNILNKFGILLSANNEFMRATSVVNGDNKKVFLFGNSSQAFDTLHNLINNAFFKTGTIKKLQVPEHLGKVVKGQFVPNVQYRNNPIIKGIATVYNYVNHDSIKKNEFATMYSGESDLQWYTRNFVAGFISEVVSPLSPKGSVRYNQFYYTTSNRPNIVGAEMELLRGKEVEEGISAIIDSMLDRSEATSIYNPDYDANTTTNFSIVSKELLKKLRDGKVSKQEVVKSALKELNKKAEDFAKELHNLQITLDKDFVMPDEIKKTKLKKAFLETVQIQNSKKRKNKKSQSYLILKD